MTRFLLFLSLVGAAIYALLIFTHNVLTDGKAENTYAGQTQPNQPAKHLSSWDAYLPTPSSNKNPQLAVAQLSTQLPPQTDEPRQSDEPSQNSERGADQLAASENSATSSSGSDGAEPKPVELAKVVLAALRPITTETIVMPLARRKTMLAGVVSHLPHHQFSLLS